MTAEPSNKLNILNNKCVLVYLVKASVVVEAYVH